MCERGPNELPTNHNLIASMVGVSVSYCTSLLKKYADSRLFLSGQGGKRGYGDKICWAPAVFCYSVSETKLIFTSRTYLCNRFMMSLYPILVSRLTRF